MVDRIRILLQTRQLSTTQFADAIGVARPIMSHILSGRNKPSLEVVQRILAAFPELSMAWLLNGTEPMLTAAPAIPVAEPAPAPVIPAGGGATRQPVSPPVARVRSRATASAASSLPNDAPAAVEPSIPAPIAAPLSAPPAAEIPVTPPVVPPALAAPMPTPEALSPAAPLHSPVLPAAAPAALPPEVAFLAAPGKTIRRIVIFYNDGSFADYQPE
jgi:transcriptional regulator with XRE-family HTH domain